jgi:hypothetical protein
VRKLTDKQFDALRRWLLGEAWPSELKALKRKGILNLDESVDLVICRRYGLRLVVERIKEAKQ